MCARVPQSDATVTAKRSLSTGLSQGDLDKLATHDVVLLIDKSYSMTKLDCLPSALDGDQTQSTVSRWRWCQEQTLDLTEKIKDAMPAGITVVLFNGNTSVYNNVDAKAIETIFSDNRPKGNTNTAVALKGQLDQYFERRYRLGKETKPLLVAVITDGCPNVPSSLRYAIVDATRQMTTPEEISITFLQVGNDAAGGKILKGLDSGLVSQNAQFDIVDLVSFTELRKKGLARALVEIAKK
jgi:hypothetical protein